MPAEACIRIAREFATNSEQSNGRSMIIMGAGICQWFHADVTYRSILSMLILTGCMGRNGGGWAHYVGQEKCWPITGWISLANALDWSRPPRTMIGTAYWYMHTDQWRFDGYAADALTSPLAEGHMAGMHTADTRTRLGTRKDLVAAPMQHDTPGETAQPHGVVRDWKRGDVLGMPGKTMPSFQIVERDYTAIADKLAAVGPLAEKLGFTVKNITYRLEHQTAQLAASGGVMLGGAADRRPAIDTDAKMAEAILIFSGTTNGEFGVQGFRTLEQRTGVHLADLAEGRMICLLQGPRRRTAAGPLSARVTAPRTPETERTTS